MTSERLTWHLENWVEWISASGDQGDYSSRAGSGIGKSNSRDFDAMCAECDTVCARAVQAILDGLAINRRLAVYNRHLATVWRLAGHVAKCRCMDCDGLYVRAIADVGAGLDRRGIV